MANPVMIGNVVLGKKPVIVLSSNGRTMIPGGKPDLFHLREDRLDLFESCSEPELGFLFKPVYSGFKAIPIILTIRSEQEGGQWKGSESERLSLFQRVIPAVNTHAIDIELSSPNILNDVIDSAHNEKKTVIVSYHDFKKTPSIKEMEGILRRAKGVGADIVKIATFANDYQDIQRMAQFTVLNKDQNIVTISMGGIGALSRLFYPMLGSLLIYTCPPENKTAPGQIDCKKLETLIKEFYPKI